jgi:hypothetical protein
MACRQGLGDAAAVNPWRLWVQDKSFGASRAGLAGSPSALSLLRAFRAGGLSVGGSFPTAVVGWVPAGVWLWRGLNGVAGLRRFSSYRESIRLVDRARRLVHISSYRPRAGHQFSYTHYGSGGRFRCPHPVPRSYNNSIASTGPHPGFKINSATYFTEKSMRDVHQTFKAMIWCG